MATNRDFKVKNGLIVSGDIQQDNAQYLRSRLANGTSTRTFGINAGNTIYIGSIDTATGGDMLILNGTERMRITAAGNVSIGDVSAADYGSGFRSLALGSSTGGGIFDSMYATARAASMFTTAGEARLDAFGSRPWNFYTGNSERMRILASGAVLIGTTAQLNTNQFGVLAPTSTNAIIAQVTTNANSLYQGFNAGGVLQFQMTGNGDLYSASTVAIGNVAIQRSAKLFVNASNVTLASTTANVYVNTTNTQAIDVGGSMAFGGKVDNAGATDAPFAYIAGRKENGTTGNFAGYFQIGVTQGNASTIEAMRVTSSGNVGIGTSVPADKLHVRGTTTANQFLLNLTTDFVNAGTVSMGIGGFADASGSVSAGASFRAHHNHSVTSAVDLSFWTSPAGSGGQVERIRIDSNGQVGIGDTSTLNGLTYGRLLVVSQGAGSSAPSILHQSVNTNDDRVYFTHNIKRPAGGFSDTWTYNKTGASGSFYQQVAGAHIWANADVGTANAAATMVERMRILADGSLIIGGTVRDFEGQLEVRVPSGVASVDVFAASTSEAKIQLLNNNNSSAIGCGTGGSLIFYGNTRATERMRMDSFGNFGIGTVDLSTGSPRLAVNGSIRVEPSGSSIQTTSAGDLTINASNAAGQIAFRVAGAERARITTAGDFCIGTTSASRKLTVAGNAGIGILPTNQDGISTLSASSAGITLLDCYHNSVAQQFVVQVQPTGGASTAERLRVNAAGITVTGTVTETSTIRIKKNIRPIEGALEKVMGLQGVVYDMKDDSAHEQHGLIAEEVQKVLPNVVYRDEDGEVAGVQYARVVAVLIEAMKEQEARIKALEAIIAKG